MLRCLILLSSLCFPAVSQAEIKQSIHWLYSEMPPAHILQGQHKNTGYADLTMQLLINSLPEYKHVKVLANYKRSISEIGAHDNMCHVALLKTTDREEAVNYSVPAYILSANKLFVQPSKKAIVEKYLTEQKKVNLADLLANEDFILGVSNGAKYGDPIDKTLEMVSSRDNLVFRSAIDHYSGLSKMLEKRGRLDGFLGLTIEDKYHQQLYSKFDTKLLSYSIAGAEDFLIGYVGCSNSEFGKQVIATINKILLMERADRIKDYYQYWLFDEGKKSHQRLIDKQFSF